jgi:hypothetical protein
MSRRGCACQTDARDLLNATHLCKLKLAMFDKTVPELRDLVASSQERDECLWTVHAQRTRRRRVTNGLYCWFLLFLNRIESRTLLILIENSLKCKPMEENCQPIVL